MNRSEALQWMKHHASLFPDWGNKLRNVSNAQDVTETNIRRLESVSLCNAIKASEEMADGRLEKPFRDEDHLPAIRLRASELDAQDAFEQASAKTALGCDLCDDSGWVAIVSPTAVKMAQDGVWDALLTWHQQHAEAIESVQERFAVSTCRLGELIPAVKEAVSDLSTPPVPAKSMPSYVNAYCICRAGEVRIERDDWRRREKPKGMAIPPKTIAYIPDTHFRWNFRLPAWRNVELMKAFEAKPANWVDEFDAWNQEDVNAF